MSSKSLTNLYKKLFKQIYSIVNDHDNCVTEFYFYLNKGYTVVKNEDFKVELVQGNESFDLYMITVNYNEFSLTDILKYLEIICNFNEKIEKEKIQISKKFSKQQEVVKPKQEKKEIEQIVEKEEYNENMIEEVEMSEEDNIE